jgi:hypothetical protein
MGEREQKLLARIAAAFSNVPYPGDDDLTNSSYGEEPEALIAEFRGQTEWRELSPDFLDRACWGSALSFFSDAALRFYLPAYLMADIRGELSMVAPTVRLTAFLTPQDEGQKLAKVFGGGTMGESARRCFDTFDTQQVVAVIEYLSWRLDEGDIDSLTIAQALENYWLKRAPSR